MAGPSAKRSYVRTDYVRKVNAVARVCRRIEGGESLAEICRDPTMPGRTTLMSWLARYAELRERVEAARAAFPEAWRVYHRWSEVAATEFLERIKDGRGLVEVCAEPDMPAHCTVTRWLNERPEFAQRYQAAREAQAVRLFDLAWRIACDAEPGEVETARLKINVLKWRVGRLVPRKYGPWKAVEPPAEAGGDDKPQRLIVEVRHFAVAPGRRVVETTRAVRGLNPEQVKLVHRAVEAGRFTEGPDGQAAEVFWEDTAGEAG